MFSLLGGFACFPFPAIRWVNDNGLSSPPVRAVVPAPDDRRRNDSGRDPSSPVGGMPKWLSRELESRADELRLLTPGLCALFCIAGGGPCSSSRSLDVRRNVLSSTAWKLLLLLLGVGLDAVVVVLGTGPPLQPPASSDEPMLEAPVSCDASPRILAPLGVSRLAGPIGSA